MRVVKRVAADLCRFVAVSLAAGTTWILVYGVLSFIRWDTVTCAVVATVLAVLNGLTVSYQSLDTTD